MTSGRFVNIYLGFWFVSDPDPRVNAHKKAQFHADRRNNSFRCLLQRLLRPQDAGTPSNMHRHTCHLGDHYPGPALLDFGDQMGSGMSNVARHRSPKKEKRMPAENEQVSQKKL
jgi:hypothetical protein